MSTPYRGKLLSLWGRGLFVCGLVGLVAGAAPALVLAALPGFEPGLLGTIAALLSLSVAPLMAVVASVGAILLLAGAVRRWLDRSS